MPGDLHVGASVMAGETGMEDTRTRTGLLWRNFLGRSRERSARDKTELGLGGGGQGLVLTDVPLHLVLGILQELHEAVIPVQGSGVVQQLLLCGVLQPV